MYPDRIDGPVVSVGDCHGAFEQVAALLDFLTAYGLHEGRWVVFLGDYCDCGPDTASTIELLLAWCKLHPQTTCLAGNHDLNLAKGLGLVESPHQAYYEARIPTRNAQTLASYGAKDACELWEKMPESHREFLRSLPWVIEHPDFVFAHAGLKADEPYQEQMAKLRARDTTLFKTPWLYDTSLAWKIPPDTNKVIVSGHTTLAEPWVMPRRILLDTGAGRGGPLTACLLPERLLIQVPASVGNTKSYQGACRPMLENKNAC
jgi:serine/threonine protein phosphatase 1